MEPLSSAPLQNIMQEGAGAGAFRESMLVDRLRPLPVGNHCGQGIGHNGLVLVTQVLLLRILTGRCEVVPVATASAIGDRGIACDPPVFPGFPHWLQGVAKLRLLVARVNVVSWFRHGRHIDCGLAGGHGLQEGHQVRVFIAGIAANQVPQTTLPPAFDAAGANPGGVTGSGQGNVEFANILTQSFAVGPGQGVFIRLKGNLQSAFVIVVLDKRLVRLFLAEFGGKRQEHQRVLQAFGLVDSNHLDQPGITFQAHGAVFVLIVGILQHLGVVVNERMFAVQLLAVLLKQFGNMQNVGQAAFAVRPGQQLRRHVIVHQQAPQHRQYALLLPEFTVALKAVDLAVQRILVTVQTVQLLISQAHGGRGECRANQRKLARFGAGLQPLQHLH